MAESTEKHLKLVVSAYTQGAETGLSNIAGSFARLRSDAPGTAKALRDASTALDVRPMRQVNQEVEALRRHYQTLASTGVLSQRELAQAAANLKVKTAELRAEYAQLGRAQEQTNFTTRTLTGSVGKLVAGYLSYRTATAVIGGMVTAAREAEQAQFNLTASVTAAHREFSNTGDLDHWQSKVGELAAELKIYSESEVANAISRTVDMTKRLGLSAEQMEEVTRRAADLSAGKTHLAGGVERVTAALRGEAESAEYLGLTLNETYIASWHAAHNAHGRAWKDLTDIEKAQVRYLVLLEQSDGMQGRAAASAGTLSGALQQIRAEVADAIANNREFADAMTKVAEVIRDNATGLGEWAAGLATATGKIIEFVAENKELITTLAVAGGVLYGLNVTNKALLTIGTTLDLLRKKKMADMALNAAGGMSQMAGAAGAAALAFKGLVVYQAALAPGRVMELVQTIREWRVAAGEADAAHRRLMAGVAENLDKFAAYKDFRLPGVDGKSTEQLQAYRAELAKAHAYWTNMLIDLQARSQQTNWLGQLTEDAKAAAAQLPAVEARLQQVKNELGQVGGALRTAAETGAQSVMTLEQALEMVSQAAARTAYNDQLLADALTRAADTAGTLRAKVEELAAAYIEADAAARLAVGTEEHAAALKAKLDAETAYAQAVQQLRSQQWSEAAQQYADEEKRLKQHLEQQLLEFETKLQLEWITQADFNYRKAKAEQDLAQAQVALRQQAVDKSAELYGEDSREYRQAVSAKIDAELALQRAARATQQQWRVMVGLADSGQKAGQRLAATLEEVGEAGERGGSRAAAGIRQIGRAADEATAKVGKLRNAMDKNAGKGGQGGETGPSVAQWFASVWNAITEKIQGLGWDERARYEQQQYRNIYHRTARGSWMTEDLNKHAANMVRRRRDQLRAEQQVRVQSAVNAIREQEQQAAGPVAPGARGAAKTLTVEFRAPNGQAVRGQFEEGEAGRLLDVLRQAGAVTA